jgi:hypothetical protein
MRKVLTHNNFLIERDLSEKVDELIMSELLSEYYSLNESTALDTLKNVLSKGLLGPFSRITVIDTIRKGNLDAQKEIIKRDYDLDDEILKIKMKIDKIAPGPSSNSQISSLHSQVESKKKEYASFVKMKKEQMEKGMRLLEKTIGKNERRREYYEAGFLDDKYELAKYEYELAKLKTKDKEKLEKLQDKLDNAAEKVKDFTDEAPKKVEVRDISVKDLGDIAYLKKKVGSKDVETVRLLKSKTADRVDELKKEMLGSLRKMEKFLETSPTWEQIKKSAVVGLGINELKKRANELDSLRNLQRIYMDLLADKEKAKKDLNQESSLTDLMSKINAAILDGNDSKSGITQEVVDLSTKTELKKVKELITKLS